MENFLIYFMNYIHIIIIKINFIIIFLYYFYKNFVFKIKKLYLKKIK